MLTDDDTHLHLLEVNDDENVEMEDA